MSAPAQPKIYHIVNVDKLPSIIADGCLFCDAEISRRVPQGTTIGMNHIKQRRLNSTLPSYPQIHVGDCVPFNFCPRSVMLYLIWKANDPDLSYRGGQVPIVHLEADLRASVAWAEQNHRRWVFTLSNAGSFYFEDRHDLTHLNDIDWRAVQAIKWQSCKEEKQAEFLVGHSFPWTLVERIGVYSEDIYRQVANALTRDIHHRPLVEIRGDWYY